MGEEFVKRVYLGLASSFVYVTFWFWLGKHESFLESMKNGIGYTFGYFLLFALFFSTSDVLYKKFFIENPKNKRRLCLDCYNKLKNKELTEKDVIMHKKPDFCSECDEYKQLIAWIKRMK